MGIFKGEARASGRVNPLLMDGYHVRKRKNAMAFRLRERERGIFRRSLGE